MTNELDEAIRGCLLGGAVGDALGAPIEFAHWPEIKEMFGPTGVTEVLDPGHFTDDTQMTLFTAEALLIAAVEMERTGVCLPRTLLHHAYLRWLVTQAGELPAVQIPAEEPLGWLLDVPLLHRVEAPGLTCLGALVDHRPRFPPLQPAETGEESRGTPAERLAEIDLRGLERAGQLFLNGTDRCAIQAVEISVDAGRSDGGSL